MKITYTFWTYDPQTQDYTGTNNQQYTTFDECQHAAWFTGKHYKIVGCNENGELYEEFEA